MIQRKQSIWLLIAAVSSGLTLLVDVYRAQYADGSSKAIRIADHYPSLLLALVCTIVPLIAIFLFNVRKRQLSMSFVAILSNISLVGMMLSRVGSLSKQMPAPTGGSYWIAAVLPAVSLIFLILAIMGIRKDENLVKSMDRLR